MGREPHQDDEPDAVPRAPAGRAEPEDALGGEGAPLLLLRLGVEVQHPCAEHGLLRTGDTYIWRMQGIKKMAGREGPVQ